MRISDWSSYVCSSDLLVADPASGKMTRHLWLMAAALLLGIAPAGARRKPVAPPPAPSTDTLVEHVNGYTLDKAGTLVRFNGLLIDRSEEHTSELQSLMRLSYYVFCSEKQHKSTSAHSSSM